MEQTSEILPAEASNVEVVSPDKEPSEQRRARGRKAAQARWAQKALTSGDKKPLTKRRATKAPEPSRSFRRETRVFSIALTAAEKRLAKAIEERARAASTWAVLNAEIPSLQRTIAALRNQQAPNAFEQNYQGSLPDGSTGTYAPNVGYNLAQVISDAPMPSAPRPEVSARALAASRARGGAIGVEIEEATGTTDNEDQFLDASGMNAGNWH